MASTPVQFFCPSGLTLTLKLFAHGSDVLANGAGDACVEKTNCLGLYEATVTEALAGMYDAVVLVGADVLANYHVELRDTTTVYRCGEYAANMDAMVDDGIATFDRTTDSLQAIRDRGDAAWISDSSVLLSAEIATVTSQTVFTLATGSDEDDCYNGQLVILYDDSNSDYPSVRYVTDYVGATRTLTISTAADFTVGDDDSLRIMVGATADCIWGQSARTLTQTAAQVLSVLEGSDLTIQRGDTLVIAFTGLGDISTRTKLWFGLKASLSDADTAAKVRIEETIGLETINGAVGTPANGSIVVTNATTGAVTVTLAAVESAKLVIAPDWHYDVQVLTAAGTVETLSSGWAEVVGDVVRATS